MRPRQAILLVGADAQRLSVRAFLLDTRGYRVACAGSIAEALQLLRLNAAGTFDLLLMQAPIAGLDPAFVEEARRVQPEMRTLLLSETRGMVVTVAVDVYLPPEVSSPAELLERIRVLLARKRGPRKEGAVQWYVKGVA